MATTPESVYCEVCKINLNTKVAESHFTGKKHIARQNQVDRVQNSVFVSGVENVPRNVMYQLFNKYGTVEEISDYEGKNFCFIKYSNRKSVERALSTRLFFKNRRLFIRNVKPQNNNDQNTGSRNAHQEQENLDIEISAINVQSDGIKSVFDLQLEELVSRIQLGDDEYRKHLEICNDLEETFKFLGASAIIFGSCGTGLAMKNSDIDIFLDCSHGQPEETFVSRDCKVMYKSRSYTHIIRIGKARVPIVRFIHRRTGIRCDVTVKNKLGVMNSKLIKFLVSLDQRIRPFIVLLKFWAKEYSITINSQLSSYALTMMAVFYLQQLEPPLLPPISELITSDEIQGGWHCGFVDNPREVSLQENNISVKEIIKGFFEFYATFEYDKYVICPLLGQSVLINDFENPERLPDTLEDYKNFIKDNLGHPFKVNIPLRIQDPFELNYNLARGFTDKLLKLFLDACAHSYVVFQENEDEKELLSTLLVVSKKVGFARHDEQTFRVPWSMQGLDETGNKKRLPKATTEAINEWYTLVKKAVVNVFREILKLNIEEADSKVSNKIKKSSNQNDVHTFETAVFYCSGNTLVFSNRKKLRRRLKFCLLDDYEKEVRVSNSRQCYQVDESKSLSFLVTVSLDTQSSNEIPRVLVTLRDCSMEKGNLFNQLLNFLRNWFETIMERAVTHVLIKRKTSSFIELTDLLNCDCDGCKTIDEIPTAKPKSKNSCNTSTSSIQLNKETKDDEKMCYSNVIEPTVSTETEMTSEITDCSNDVTNPFLMAIERHISEESVETDLNSTNKNESDNNSQTLWNRNDNDSDTYNDINIDNSKIGNSNITDSESNTVNDGRTSNNVVENVRFVNKMFDALVRHKDNEVVLSYSVDDVQDPVTTSSNGQINEKKNVDKSSSLTACLPVSHRTCSKENVPLSGNMKHNLTWNEASNSQTNVNCTHGFISMKAARKFHKISLEMKPPTKNTATVEDIKLYVKKRFQCENVDDRFLLALTKITNDIRNNSNKS